MYVSKQRSEQYKDLSNSPREDDPKQPDANADDAEVSDDARCCSSVQRMFCTIAVAFITMIVVFAVLYLVCAYYGLICKDTKKMSGRQNI